MALGAAEGFQILPSPPKPSAVLAKKNKGKGLDAFGFSCRLLAFSMLR
jgi:hypothetical protein